MSFELKDLEVFDLEDAREKICEGCPMVNLTYRSQAPMVHDGPDEYCCPLDFNPKVVFTDYDCSLTCSVRHDHENDI